MNKKAIPMSEIYRLLEPGPVVMVTTSRQGQANVMTMSWHTMIDFEPPIVGCVMSDQNYSYDILKETKDCVINIPTFELISKVVGVGNTSGRRIDKFKKFQLLQEVALKVSPPLLSECFVNLECKVIDRIPKYELFILEVVQGWIRPSKKRARTIHHCGRGVFVVDGKIVKVASKKK